MQYQYIPHYIHYRAEEYPVMTSVDPETTPVVQEWRIRNAADEHFRVSGCLLGQADTRTAAHTHPPDQSADILRCNACRWNDVRIWAVEPDVGDTEDERGFTRMRIRGLHWIVGIRGQSVLPGETDRYRAWWATAHSEVVSTLLVTSNHGERVLPVANRIALMRAAVWDLDFLRALREWESSNA